MPGKLILEGRKNRLETLWQREQAAMQQRLNAAQRTLALAKRSLDALNPMSVLRRGFAVTPGMKVLVVEDVVTTGGSAKEVIELARAAGGTIVGVGAIVDRTGGKMDFGVPFHAALSMEVASYEPEQCPICKPGAPLVKPGSRKLTK